MDAEKGLDTNPAVIAYRIGSVEQMVKDLRGEMREAIGQVGGGLTALQTQLSSYQQNSVRPRDFDELQRRVDSMASAESARGWYIAAALFTGVISLLGVAFMLVGQHVATH